jgi:hypothetical protein
MSESLSTLLDLFSWTEFRTGLVIGAIALAALALAPRSPAWARPWGLAFTAAVLIGTEILDRSRTGVLGGIALMALGGWLVGAGRSGSVPSAATTAGWLITFVGAMFIPWRGDLPRDAFLIYATLVLAMGFAAALSTWSTRAQLRWLGPLVAITAFAMWSTVPDTEDVRLLLGVALPLALGTLPPVSASLTTAGSFALGGLLAWLPTLGGAARPASTVGAWACLGVIVLLPIATLLWPQRSIGTPAMFGLQGIIALVAARVIGLWTDAMPAVIAVVALYAAGLGAIHWLGTPASESDVKTEA